MSNKTAGSMMIHRRFSPGRIIIGLFLAPLTGWIVWVWLSDLLEVQPLYRLRDFATNRLSYFNVAGPWLCIFQETADRSRVITQYRRLTDGQLEFQTEQSPSDVVRYYQAIDHPDLGPNTLVGIRRRLNKNWELVQYLHTIGEEHVIHQWNSSDAYLELSNSGMYFIEQHTLPLTPLLLWGITGMPDAIRAEFYNYLGNRGNLYSASFVALIRVYSTLDGRLLGECALPSQTGTFVSPRLLDDGKHVALSFRPFSDKLSQYFLAKSKPDEDQSMLASILPGLILMNFRTCQIVKEWPDLGDCSLDHVSSQMWLHRSNNIPPLMHWASSRPDKVELRLLDTQARQLIDLERPENHFVEEVKVGPHGYQMFSWHCDHDAQQRCIQTTLLCTTFDSTGKTLFQSSAVLEGRAQGQLINNQRQIIVNQDFSQPWHQLWWSWMQRWPWLKNIYQGYSGQWYVWDVDTNDKHLTSNSRINIFEASPDGRFLLVGKGTNDLTEELSVYPLPFLPQAWWTLWLPRLAGLLTTLLVFWICLLYFSRQRNQFDSRHSLKTT